MSVKQKIWICMDILFLIVLYLISSTDYVWHEKEILVPDVVFITDTPKNAAAINLQAGAEKAAEQYHADLKFLFLEDMIGQDMDMKKMVERELENGCDGIVLQCSSRKQTDDILQKIPIGLPVILYNTIADSPRMKSFVGAKSQETLEKTVQSIVQMRENEQTVLLVSQKNTKETVMQFQEMLENALKQSGVETKNISLANPQEANTLLYGLEQQKNTILFTADVQMLEALAEAKQTDTLALCGVGWSGKIRNALEQGDVQWTLAENNYISGYESVRKVAEFLNRTNFEQEELFTENVIVTQQNLYQKETELILFPFV